ncbi:MAG: DUF5050 domain-containing protein, partial [bacterium]|nr:DUF5050 domain-containing protein [bacterium]
MIPKRVLWLIGTIILGIGLVSPAMAQEGRIVFNNGNDGNIYMMSPDGSNLTPLTSGPAVSSRDQMPYLSSDHRVVYSSKLIGGYQIWIMNDDGSDTTKLTSFSGGEYPMLSPDGTKIVFHHQGAGNYDIWMMDDDGTNLIQLTNNPADDKNPCFSVDGSKIIFSSKRDGNYEIYIMNIDGSNQINLTNSLGSNESFPNFSPDGNRITFTSNLPGNEEVYIMDADGSNWKRLTINADWDGYSSFSPDGTKLVYLHSTLYTWNIWTMNIDGSNLTQITSGTKAWNPRFGAPDPPAAPTNFAGSAVSSSRIDLSWTDNADNEAGFKLDRRTGTDGVWMNIALLGPNITSYQNSGLAPNTTYYYKLRAYNGGGNSDTSAVNFTTQTSSSPGSGRIVFSSDPGGNRDVYIISADNTGATRLTDYSGLDDMPFLSSDGHRIAFVSARTGNNDIWIMKDDRTDTLQLTTSAGDDRYPAISPDGSKIVFQSRRDGNWEIYIMDIDGGNQTNLTGNLADDENPRFSPDGTRIIFHSTREGGDKDVYVMGIDGQGVTALIDNVSYTDWYSSFSPQGDRIAFTSDQEVSPPAIYIANFDGSNPVKVSNSGFYYPSFSPDGARLCVLSANMKIWTMNLDGSNPVNLNVSGNVWNPCYGPPAGEDTVPLVPTNLAATAVSSSQINLTWTDNATNETGFKIERKIGAGGTYDTAAIVGPNVATYSDTGLAASTTYYYRVRA